MFDAALSAERFCEVHRQQLLAAGWNEDDDRPGRSGFVPRGLPMRFRAAYRFPRLRRRLGLDHPGLHSFFRLGARGPKLVVAVQDRQNAPTDIHLHLITGQRDPWLIHDPAWEVIPSLVSPPSARGRPEAGSIGVLTPPFGARELGGNWGGSGRYRENDGAYSFVALETDLDLAAHYAAQFEGAG